MSHYFLCSQNKHSKNRRHFQCIVSDFVAAEFPTVRNPPAFLPRTPLRAGQKPRQGGTISPSQMFRPAESALVFRIFRKMGSDFFKQTPPFKICRRSCLGASPLGIGFRQEIPGGFEFRQKNSRRKSAVPKQSLDCAKGARADEERFLEIVGVSAMPLNLSS